MDHLGEEQLSLWNLFAQYELCYGNRFHVNSEGRNIKSTGFKIFGESSKVYLTDIPNISTNNETGSLSIFKIDSNGNKVIVGKDVGTVDYKKGELIFGPLNIVETDVSGDVIEIQAFPESNDVVGLRDLYISLNVSKSTINMVRDVIASGDEISGSRFVNDFYTSSYSNGNLIRE